MILTNLQAPLLRLLQQIFFTRDEKWGDFGPFHSSSMLITTSAEVGQMPPHRDDTYDGDAMMISRPLQFVPGFALLKRDMVI